MSWWEHVNWNRCDSGDTSGPLRRPKGLFTPLEGWPKGPVSLSLGWPMGRFLWPWPDLLSPDTNHCGPCQSTPVHLHSHCRSSNIPIAGRQIFPLQVIKYSHCRSSNIPIVGLQIFVFAAGQSSQYHQTLWTGVKGKQAQVHAEVCAECRWNKPSCGSCQSTPTPAFLLEVIKYPSSQLYRALSTIRCCEQTSKVKAKVSEDAKNQVVVLVNQYQHLHSHWVTRHWSRAWKRFWCLQMLMKQWMNETTSA